MKGSTTGHYVSIRPDEVEKFSEGGIALAAQYNEDHKSREVAATTTGTVIDVGPNAWVAFDDGEPWAKVGDRVAFVRHTAKILDDEDNFDVDGKPKKIFVLVDENIIFNFGGKDDE